MDQAALTRTNYRGVEILSREDTEAAVVGQRLFFTKKDMMNAAIDVAQDKGKFKNAAQSPRAQRNPPTSVATHGPRIGRVG